VLFTDLVHTPIHCGSELARDEALPNNTETHRQ
jgi:hypothetical protein